MPVALESHTFGPQTTAQGEAQLILRLENIRPPLAPGTGAPDLASPVIRTVIAASVAINLLVLAVPLYINRIYSSVLPQKAGDSLLVITLLLLAVLVVDVMLKVGRAWVLSWLAASQEHQLRLGAIRSLLAAPLADSESASVDRRLDQLRAAFQLRGLFEQQWLVRYIDVPFAVVYLLVLALIGGWLVVIPLALVPLFLWRAGRASSRMATAIRQKQRSETFRNDATLACLEGAPTVKALNLEGFLVRRLEPSQERYAQASLELDTSTAQLQNLGQLFSQWSQLLIVSFGGWLVINQSLSSGALAACTLLSGQVTLPLSKLLTAKAQQASVDLAVHDYDSLRGLTSEPHLLRGEPVPAEGELSTGALRLSPGATAVLLGGAPHQSSRFLASLTGLADAMPVDLRFAGQSTQAMERITLRQRLRLVKNGRPLLRGTLLDYLTLFRAAEWGDRATDLCDQHGVASSIRSLPRGYATPIGEGQDFPLSSGLVFRLQVIQALMTDPAVLLVDGSELDLQSDQLAWLLGLKLKASRLVALTTLANQALPAGCLQLQWQGEQLVEVAA